MSRYLTVFFIIIIFFRQIIYLSANNDTYINTTNIVYDEDKDIIELSKNSKININNTNILVDRGIIDYKNDKIEVFGDFYLYQGINILSGKDLQGDTNLNNFMASDVSYIYNDDLKIDSESAKRSEKLIYFYNNFLTPCELDGYFGCPTWSLRIDETKYDVDKDKFVHFDTFLQIADYKLFYLPYFSHYGVKAPRQRGFLTPSIEFEIGGNSGIYTPYYLPIRNNTDIKFTPKFIFSESFDFINNYRLNTLLNYKMSGGELTLEVDNIKNANDTNINTSAVMNFRQVLDKNKVLSFNGLLTNSISTTRSINEEPVKFENIYIKLDNYDLFLKDDYLKSEINTVEAFDSTANISLIPITPSFKYQNNFYFNENISNQNEINLLIITRDESQTDLPSENNNLKINNYFVYNKKFNKINTYNKLSLLNGFSDYTFKNNNSLNSSESFNHLIFSSDIHANLYEKITPRIKFIFNQDFNRTGGIINEDSEAITFNYQNSYSDKRFYGTDLKDNTSRLVYGFENDFSINNKQININASQSYDITKNNNYSSKINQNSKFSDYAVEGTTKVNNFFINIDTRLDRKSLKNKELNLILSTDKPFDVSLNYHQTSKDAFLDKSNDTEYLGVNIRKEINENLIFSYGSSIDLKNNFSPYYDTLGLKIYDECSELSIEYSNKRYNDQYNTAPEEIISISFNMDYLGFFGYEQTTDLFFQEPGSFDYGL